MNPCLRGKARLTSRCFRAGKDGSAGESACCADMSLIPGSHGRRSREEDSQILTSDPHVCAVAQAHTSHTDTITLNKTESFEKMLYTFVSVLNNNSK